MRLAVFTPLAPVRSGISTYSAHLLPALAAAHAVDVFVEDEVWIHHAARLTGRAPNLTQSGGIDVGSGLQLWRAHDFIARHVLTPYDLIVYQLGNATCHEYMWPYLLRYPGLVVLHDGQLHHARAHALLRRGRKDDYRAELRYAHPDAPPDLAEFIVAGLTGPLYYMWPLVALVMQRARAIAVHNARLADDLRAQFPEAAIEVLRMGTHDPQAPQDSSALLAGLPAGGSGTDTPRADRTPPASTPAIPRVTFSAFGLVTPEKRIPQVLRALAAILKMAPEATLRLVGDTTSHYDVRAEADALGLADRVEITGYVPDDQLPAYLAATDVCVCLRWPTTRETSASWLDCLAAGKPTIINDLAHLVDIPTLDPRSWTLLHAREEAASANQPPRTADAVAVSIDILDEDHSLELAMRRLATDAALRETLGRTARRFWEADHTLAHMIADYTHALAAAAARPAPDAAPALPPHVLQDHTRHARTIAAELDVTLDW